MMSTINFDWQDMDPFGRNLPLSEENVLKVNVIRLRSDQLPNDLNTAIELLSDMRDTLGVIKKIGRITELGMLNFYLDALRWLHFEMPLTNFIGVPQIDALTSVDATIANQFKQYVESYWQHLRSNALYTATEASRAAFRQTVSQQAQAQVERLEEDAENSLQQVAQTALDELRQKIAAESSSVDRVSAQAQVSLQQLIDAARQSIDNDMNNATQSIRAAQSLQNWGETYDKAIKDYQKRLYGKKWAESTFRRNFVSLGVLFKKHASMHEPVMAKLFFIPIAILGVLLKNLWNTCAFVLAKSRSYSGKRTIWFTLLFSFAVLFVVMSFATLVGFHAVWGINVSSVTKIHNQQWYLKFTVYIPVALILGLAYSFSIKNYRIYSNMLDQYEHRKAVANTAQGIILSLKESSDMDLRGQVTAAAAAALFEHKNTGHLTKIESESLNGLDMFRSVSGR
jgi:hypothetical protein